VLNASQDRPFVMTQAGFVDWVAPQVEREEKAKAPRPVGATSVGRATADCEALAGPWPRRVGTQLPSG
jgi:hypothetical protein